MTKPELIFDGQKGTALKKTETGGEQLIVWALFDSGKGAYYNAAQEFEDMEIFSIGIDRLNKNSHFINLDLADYSRLFENDILFKTLDKLPKPDLIIASPPCESWSVASAMQGGNASWKQEQGDALFEPQEPLSRFTIREHKDYLNYQFKYERSFFNRINGELCTYNTIKIIERYKPSFYIIENPATSRMWEYIESVIGFDIPHDNLTYYSNYNYPLMKPTKFKSNIDLELDDTRTQGEVAFKDFSKDYNERSNIPKKLVMEIFKKVVTKSKEGA